MVGMSVLRFKGRSQETDCISCDGVLCGELSMEPVVVFRKALNFTIPVLLIIGSGLAVAEILEETGIIQRISPIGRPLSRFARLPEVCGIAVVTATVSFLAANAMLQNMRENRVLTDRETFFASLLTGAVAPIKVTFTYHLPVILPALGLYAGCIYVATLWLGSIALLLFVLVVGRILLKDRKVDLDGFEEVRMIYREPQKSFKKALFRFLRRFARIGGTFFAVTVVVFFLVEAGLMLRIEHSIMPLAERLHLPGATLPAVAAYIASPIVGISMMGSLGRQHLVTDSQIITALLFGSIFMLPVLYLRFYLPQWISIFGIRLGTLRAVTSMVLVMAVRVAVLLAFMTLS
ncbi:hypothetical protein [Thermodesulforhabdus norvegica]|uniref:Nucleoside recognition protein n=1 Tax=Thermodesulforhabdus norvegica TaxID=39841 RepID=A0A1I4RNM5_9BACT|nr:hypothetical protein [Thermodesulforhabdus norvegica]SFM53553.1 hypothetical protein SAMN05660836_00706 [Thermodesulforhabdus norvegica]